MTLAVLVFSSSLVLMGLARAGTRTVKRGLIYWWAWSTFGLQSVHLVLGATGVVDIADEAIALGFVAPTMAVSILLVVRAVTRDGVVSVGGLLCVAPVAVSMAFILAGYSVLTPLFSIASLSVAIVFPAEGYEIEEIVGGLVASLRLVAALFLLLAVIRIPGLIGECRLDKCSLWGEQIGGAGNANGFGVAVAFLGIVVALGMTWKRATAVLVGTALLTDLASSRSAILPLTFGLIAIIVERRFRGTALKNLRAVTLFVACASVAAAPLGNWAADDFSGRVLLWYHALELISERPLLGWGVSHWVRQPPTTAVEANYSAHNLLLELGVSFGIVGLVAVIAGVVAVRRSLHPTTLALWHTAVVCWIAGGVTEVIAAPGRPYLLQGAFILPLVLAFAASSRTVSQAEMGRHPAAPAPMPLL